MVGGLRYSGYLIGVLFYGSYYFCPFILGSIIIGNPHTFSVENTCMGKFADLHGR